jgi:hypothetical protein
VSELLTEYHLLLHRTAPEGVLVHAIADLATRATTLKKLARGYFT